MAGLRHSRGVEPQQPARTRVEIRVVRHADLALDALAEIRALLVDAFEGEFSDHDWDHTVGGWRVLATDDGLVSHAAVVERVLDVGARRVRTGYVEGVGTAPSRQREGLGARVMRRVGDVLRAEFEMGALSTGRPSFYERLGWERWLGPTYVRHGERQVRTADEDGGVMVLRHGPSAGIDLGLPISCEARAGDDW